VLHQRARPAQRLDLLDEGQVQGLLGGADVVALALLGVLGQQRGDELVAAHADVAVGPPDPDDLAVLAAGTAPRDGVMVVGVDEGSVDVQDRCGHHSLLPDRRRRNARPNHSQPKSAAVQATTIATVTDPYRKSVSSISAPVIARASSAMPTIVWRVAR